MTESNRVADRWLLVFAIAIPAAYVLVLGLGFDRIGIEDHDQHLVFHELQFWNARLFGLAKQWTPVMCPGLSLAADPQVPLFSASMLLGYLLGPFWGLRLSTVLYLMLGWLGAWLYAGRLTPDRRVRALAAALFIGNGFFVARICKGHIPLLPFLTLPLLLWSLHALVDRRARTARAPRIATTAFATLALGGALALMIDGSPQVIVYFLPWLAIYAAGLSWTARSTVPVVVVAASLAVALPLAAGYLLPMLRAQAEFPRLRHDEFTNPIVLLWFLVLPVRGRILPAPGAGHEYSLFVGPVLLWLIWRERRALATALPRTVSRPWAVTAAFALVFGVGSLVAIGVPRLLSPFDWFRPLPGFRSIGITGRYWGFLALPLAMLAALALARWTRETGDRRRRAWVLTAALVLQLGFQVESVGEHLVQSERYRSIPYEHAFDGRGERIEYVVKSRDRLQHGLITPTRGVIDCYDMGDFLRAEIGPGTAVVASAIATDGGRDLTDEVDGVFESWTRIRLRSRRPPSPGTVEVVVRQSYNRHWTASAGTTSRDGADRLTLRVPAEALAGEGVALTFRDPASDRGVAIALRAWPAWGAAMLVAAGTAVALRRRRGR